MEILKATLHKFIHRLESHWVRFVPTVFRRVYRSICVGFLPLENSPGGFCSQATFRVRFPKPPWNLFYTTIIPVIDYCGPVSSTDYGDMNCIPLTIQHALNSTGIALIHFPAGVKEASATKILLDMLFWVLDNPAPANFMLISGDRDFFNAIHGKAWMQYGHDDTRSKSQSLTSHIHGSIFVFESEIGISVPPRSKTLLLLCIDVGIPFHLMFISSGIWELLLKFKIRDFNLRFENVIALPQSDRLVAPVHDHIGCDYVSFVMELCLHQFGFCWSAMSSSHVGLVKFWRQGLVCVVDFWSLMNALATFRWESFDMRSSGIWDAMVNLFVVMVERITKSKYFKKTVVRKFWCHHVYISGLALYTSGFMLRFVKRRFSHKLLHTNCNKEESNMKLDNNRFFDRLASKTTLRKASSNSLLLYFS